MDDLLRRLSVLAVLVGTLGWALPAGAHDVESPRVLVLTPRPDGLEIRISEMWPAGPSSTEKRKAADADGDGKLAYEERERLRQSLAAGVVGNLRVTDDSGQPLEVERLATRMRGASSVVTATELSVDVAARVALAPDPHGQLQVTLADWRGDDHDVKAVVACPTGVELVESSLGDTDASKQRVTGIRLTKKKSLRLRWRVSH